MIAAQTPKILKYFKRFTEDGRHFQILFLSIFLLYGICFLNWQLELLPFAVILLTCLVSQLVGCLLTKKSFSSYKSALITALGLCLLLKADTLQTAVLAAVLSIASKFLLRFRGKHIFNPSNLGILLALLIAEDAWVSPGQWGQGSVLLLFIGTLGAMVLAKVGRLETVLAFLASFGLMEFARNILYKGWPIDHFLQEMTNGSLLIFAFFMITDPVTTPNARRARILWAILVGCLSSFLLQWHYVHTAPIWALFLTSLFTPLFDRFFKGKKFNWNSLKTSYHENTSH